MSNINDATNITYGASYKNYIHLDNTNLNSGATGALQNMYDGAGNLLPFQLSTTGINFTGTVTGVTSASGGTVTLGSSENGTAAIFDSTNSTTTTLVFNGISAGTNTTVTGGGNNSPIKINVDLSGYTPTVNLGTMAFENKANYTKTSDFGTLAFQSGTFSGTSSGTNTGDQLITLTGAVTGSGTNTFSTTLASKIVQYSNIQDASSTSILLGAGASAKGIEEIQLGTGLNISGNILNITSGSGLLSVQNNSQSGYKVLDDTDSTLTALYFNELKANSSKITLSQANAKSAVLFDINDSALSIANTQITGATISTGASISGTNTGDQDLSTYAKSANVFVIANNLSEGNASTMRSNLGLGTLATQNGTFSGTSSGTNTGDQTITLTGDVTGSGTGSFAATLRPTGSNGMLLGSANGSKTITDITLGTNLSLTGSTLNASGGGSGISTGLVTALNIQHILN